MINRGIKPARIKLLLAENGERNQVHDLEAERDVDGLPHQDESTWLLHECSRTDAERLLEGCPDGTFLVRPSSTYQYALSIICGGNISHCIIYDTDRGFGFAEPYNIYNSLKSLVLHYAQNSLEIHNDSLKTTLEHPIFTTGVQHNDVNYVSFVKPNPR